MNSSVSVLIVDDDPCVRELLREYLQGHGWAVADADSGTQMRERIEAGLPDIVLLDLRLPGEDGLALARYLRERYDVGIIMVTASSDVIDRVVGLEIGADDYVAKPFDPRELLARVKSVLRRLQARSAPPREAAVASGASGAGSSAVSSAVSSAASSAESAGAAAAAAAARQRIGRCELDLQSRRMFESGGPEVTLTAMEFELLRVLLANPNRALSRDQLLMHTRNREWEPYDRSIDIRIGRLRRKVEPEPDGEPRCIRTVRNVGYMFVPAT